jgi:hypothetical protein
MGAGPRYWVIGFGKPLFEFDTVLRESHTLEVTVTEDPVETGVQMADHAYSMSDRLEVEIGIGDSWLGMRDPAQVDAFLAEEAAAGIDGVSIGPAKADFGWLQGDGDGDATTRSQRALEKLRNLAKSFAVIGVQTGLRYYPRLMIRTITCESDKEVTGLIARVTFSEPLFTSTETVAFPPRAAGKTTRQGSAKANRGEQKGEDKGDAVKAGAVDSVALDILKSGFGGAIKKLGATP